MIIEFILIFRFPKDHEIFTSIMKILISGFWNMDDNYYIPMSAEAVDVTYQVKFVIYFCLIVENIMTHWHWVFFN
jgi:hypothetical protein